MYKFKSTVLSLLLITITVSCSSTESVTESGATTSSVFPEWYQESGFVSDSLHYSSFATAISSDSSLSIKRAEEQARHNLESRISEIMETVRIELEDKGFDHARNADFILTLRNAHAPVESEAELTEGLATKSESHYRGFAKVSIGIEDLKNLLEAGFAGKASFWAEINKTRSFLAN